jgi:hypothetical protein
MRAKIPFLCFSKFLFPFYVFSNFLRAGVAHFDTAHGQNNAARGSI